MCTAFVEKTRAKENERKKIFPSRLNEFMEALGRFSGRRRAWNGFLIKGEDLLAFITNGHPRNCSEKAFAGRKK